MEAAIGERKKERKKERMKKEIRLGIFVSVLLRLKTNKNKRSTPSARHHADRAGGRATRGDKGRQARRPAAMRKSSREPPGSIVKMAAADAPFSNSNSD